MSRRCIAPAFHSAPTRRLSRLSLPVEWDFKSIQAAMKDVCGRNGQTLRCVVCFARTTRSELGPPFRHASAMSSPIFLIAIFLEQRADITRASSSRQSLMTVSWILTKDEDQRFVKWNFQWFSHQSQQVDADLPKASAICYTSHCCAKAWLSCVISLYENGSWFSTGLSSVLSSWDEVCWPRHSGQLGTRHAFLMRFDAFCPVFFTSNEGFPGSPASDRKFSSFADPILVNLSHLQSNLSFWDRKTMTFSLEFLFDIPWPFGKSHGKS